MRLFGRTSIGVEIDAYEARFIELSGSPASPRTVKYGRIPMPEGAVREGIVLEPEKLSGALMELWKQNKIKNREIIVGISNQDVLVRFASFPKVPEDKLDNMIRFQAQDFLPMPVNTVIIDYMVINEGEESSPDTIEVLLVAARKAMVDSFLKSFEPAELVARDMDVTSLALWRVVPRDELNDAVAVVYLGNESGNILLMTDGVPRLARHISVNLRGFIEMDGVKKTRNSDMGPLLDTLSAEDADEFSSVFTDAIQSSISYYYVQNNAKAIRKIILCGYGGRVNGLLENLQSVIDIPVELADPLKSFAISEKCAHMDTLTASEYAVGMSLAIRGLGG